MLPHKINELTQIVVRLYSSAQPDKSNPLGLPFFDQFCIYIYLLYHIGTNNAYLFYNTLQYDKANTVWTIVRATCSCN